MALVITDTQNYVDIANAIREKNGSEDTYMPSEMAAAIQAITGDGSGESEKTITELYIFEHSGMFTVTYNDGTLVTGSCTFGEDGLPTAMSDNDGKSVSFVSGYPTRVKDKYGAGVDVLWG